jgi:hypothetical protein
MGRQQLLGASRQGNTRVGHFVSATAPAREGWLCVWGLLVAALLTGKQDMTALQTAASVWGLTPPADISFAVAAMTEPPTASRGGVAVSLGCSDEFVELGVHGSV